ncbi:MAG TPA: PfkB family carbohydrate kinase, partial [Pseudonocardiaceae bacterium]
MITEDVVRRLADRRPRVVVLGDAILDGWLSGRSDRLSPEAPVPVVQVTGSCHVPGGAANTAVNLAALGADVRLVSVVGDDRAGVTLLSELAARGVDPGPVVVAAGRRTITKRRVVVGDQIMLRVDEGTDTPLPPPVTERLLATLRVEAASCDAVLVCDYRTGVLGPEVVAELRRLRPSLPLLAVDAHALGTWCPVRPDVVTP